MDFTFEWRSADSPLIEGMWRTESNRAGTFISQAASHWEMVVWKYDGASHITVRGPETRASIAESAAGAEFFGIQFKMGTFMPHLPIGKLVNTDLTLPDAMGRSFWLHGSVWQLPNFGNAEVFVNRLIREDMLVHDPVVESVLRGREHDLSLRSVQYRFLRATGLTQNAIRQIERARQAASLLQRGVSILDTVYEAGYFDQAHLTRSLKRFMGQTPTQMMPEIKP